MQSLTSKWQKSILGRSLGLLDTATRLRVLAVILIQITFGLLDLAGVAIVGVLSALAITGVGSKVPGDRVLMVLRFLNLENQNLQTQAAILPVSRVPASVHRPHTLVVATSDAPPT